MSDTLNEMERLQTAGFSGEEIAEWAVNRRKELSNAGFNDAEIGKEFGKPILDPAPAAKVFDDNLKAATQPTTPDGQPKPVSSFTDALDAGFQMSVTGLAARGELPEKVLAHDAPRLSRIASTVGTLAGDFPAMFGGAMLASGGGPVLATGAAFALPAGMRKVMMDAYRDGSADTFSEFWERISGALIETGKGWVVGTATGLAGKAAGALPIPSPTARNIATLASEVTTMVAVGKALEGEMPNADDFIDAAIVVGGAKGAVKTAAKLRDVYAQTGVRPDYVVKDAEKDPTIGPDLLSENVDAPRAYGWKPSDRVVKEAAAPKEPPAPEPGFVLEAQEKVLSKVSVGEKSDRQPLTFDRLYTLMVDDLNPIREAVKQAATEGKLPTRDDPYQLARLTRGTFGKADQFLEYGTYDFKTYQNNGPALKTILAPVKDDLNGLRAYAVAKRTMELASREIDAGVDVDASMKVVKAGQKTYEPILKELVAYQNRVSAYLRDAGVLSSEAYDAMLEANKNYVPFFRVMEEDIGGAGLGRGVKTRQPIKGIKGSERTIVDPLESVIKNTYLYIALAERNAVGNKFVEMANRSGHPEDFIHKVAPQLRSVTLTEDEIRTVFNEFVSVRQQTQKSRTETTKTTTASGEEMSRAATLVREKVMEALKTRGFSDGEATQMVARLSDQKAGAGVVEKLVKEIEKTEFIPELDIRLPSEAATVFRAVRTPLKKNEIGVFEQGKYKVYETDPEIAEAFNAADSQTAVVLVRILAIPAKALRAGSVLSPDFMLRNLTRDQQTAFVLSKAGYFPVVDFMRGAFSLAKKDQDFQNWLKSGGANAALISMDRRYLQEQLATITEVQGVMNKVWNTAKTSFEALRILSELIENASRMGEFKRVAGGLEGKGLIQEGGMASREVVVDFARVGTKMRAVNMITAFFNAQIQGEDRMIRAFAERPAGTTVRLMAAITLPSILLYLANRDDPRWKEIPRWQKDLSWIVFTEETIWRIPKAHSAAIIFGSLPERLLEAYDTDNPGALDDLEKSFINTMWPNMIPTFAAPVVDQFANRSLFTGNPLIPAGVERLLPEYQYTEYTTEAAKALGSLIGAFPGMTERAVKDEDTIIGGTARALTTPILIENYVRSWTGGLGLYALQLADKALRETGVLPDPVKPAATLSDLPVIRAFVVRYPSATSQSIQEFYNTYYAKKRVFDTFMAKAKEGDLKAMEAVQKVDPAAWDEMGGLRETLTQQSQLIRLIYKNPDMTPTDKRQLIDTLYFRMIELSRAGNQAMADLDRAMKP